MCIRDRPASRPQDSARVKRSAGMFFFIGVPPFNFPRKRKRHMHLHMPYHDFHADADCPTLEKAGYGQSFLGPSQPGTQAPSQSGSCHLCERGARELPLSPHSLNLGQYSTLYRKKQEWKFSPGRQLAARRKEHLSGIGWARREPRWRGMAPAVRTAWPASRPQ